jgi:hypothetical protein
MARWVLRGPVVLKEEDMDDYMFEVAGRVGYLSTEVFAWYSKAIKNRQDLLMPLAKETGLALQTVNILRGLRKDFERGWIYVPESYCQLVGIRRGEMFSAENEAKVLKLVSSWRIKPNGISPARWSISNTSPITSTSPPGLHLAPDVCRPHHFRQPQQPGSAEGQRQSLSR